MESVQLCLEGPFVVERPQIEVERAVADAVSVPVVASGGAGAASHCCAAICDGGADAALVAGILHDGVTTVRALKDAMRAATLPVREVAA